MNLTPFQRFELIIIPITVLISQVFIVLFGLSIIGENIINIIGLPSIFGYLLGVIVVYILDRKQQIRNFLQVERIVRSLVLLGGFILIPIILSQNFKIIPIFSIFSVLALIFALLGGILSFLCILLLWRFSVMQNFSE
ncbi:hypothetical protein [Candidatus Hodarchaeum mangrovi]